MQRSQEVERRMGAVFLTKRHLHWVKLIRPIQNSIRWILSKSPAFEPDHHVKGHWRMTGMPLVRTSNQLSSRIMTEAEQKAYL